MLRFFRHIRKQLMEQNKVRSYILYAIGEILLVVIGILIALQINNWNQNRIDNERFNFGLTELHTEIKSITYLPQSLHDRLSFQITLIDSIMEHPSEISLRRTPGMILLFDENGVLSGRNLDWVSDYVEFDPNNTAQNNLAKTLSSFFTFTGLFSIHNSRIGAEGSMMAHLKQFQIPVIAYGPGTPYKEFIDNWSHLFYNPSLDDRIKALIRNESFLADLKSIKMEKVYILNNLGLIERGAYAVLSEIEAYYPDYDYQITYMEIIGSATDNANFNTGLPMQKISEDDNEWEIFTRLTNGTVKFRTDSEWVLDWGRSEEDPDKLIFKGGNIQVRDDYYHIKINIKESIMSFTPVEENE